MMLDFKFTMSDGTGDKEVLALTDFGASLFF